MMNKKTTFLGAVAALSGLLPISAHAALPGAELSLCWAIPFAGILLSIALGPLLFAHFWHKNYGKVALMWAVWQPFRSLCSSEHRLLSKLLHTP